MKLFVWADPYSVSYGSSMVFACAETVEAAREIASRSAAYEYGKFEDKELGWKQRVTLGEPDRVLDVPCAEWHQWSE